MLPYSRHGDVSITTILLMHTGENIPYPSIGVVIPVYQADDQLNELLKQFTGSSLPVSIVVVDGGKSDLSIENDGNPTIAVIKSDRHGRGHQLRLGTAHLDTHWFLILHADSHLNNGWEDKVRQFLDNTPELDHAGYFDFQLDTNDRKARLLEHLVKLRCRLLALPYGDQGLLIPSRLLLLCGGVPDIPLMEDVQLARKLSRRRLRRIGIPLTTSAQHYLQHGFVKRSAQNLLFVLLFYIGVKPTTLHRWYYR